MVNTEIRLIILFIAKDGEAPYSQQKQTWVLTVAQIMKSLLPNSYLYLIQWPQDWKRSDFIPIAKKGNAKECSNYHTISLILHASRVMLKILQARLQQYVNQELPDVQAGFRKGRGTRDQIANICWIIKKARVPEKHLHLLY